MTADHSPLTPGIVPFDLRSVTRGYRHFGLWLGRSEYVWLDRRLGRIAAKVAVRLPHPAVLALPGLIANEPRPGKPMLSWITLPPPSSTRCPNIADAIDDEIARYSPRCDPATLLSLMQRVPRTHALAEPRGSLQCPHGLQQSGTAIRILLIDEPAKGSGDIPASRRREAFFRMLDAVRTTHPDAEYWLGRTRHPGCGGWLSEAAASALPPTIRRLAPADSLCAAIERVDYVYTVGAPEGMHALLAEIPLHVFGDAYYAGRGLTRDAGEFPGRRRSATLPTLFEIMFLRLTRYLDPVTHSPGTLSDVLDSIELQQNVAQRFSGIRHVTGVRFQRWKRPFATPFLTASGASLSWIADARQLRSGECAALWGARSADEVPAHSSIVRIEDGFLHSTGLGSDMVAPFSQVLDRRGLYFDPSRPSDLTEILNEAHFEATELARAAALRAEIARLGLTKYNLGRRMPTWRAPVGKRVVLVPGQVADDASIRLGTRAITTAEALLREVRAQHPDAFIVYKPHPDVLSGNRIGLVDAAALADVVEVDADLISLIEIAHEVHTMSSLAGFDALLREKSVHTYGLPFYAGWGLTHDTLPQPWRKRALTLDMLIAGTLLRYPLYWDWRLERFTTPEAIVRQLARSAARPLTKIRNDPTRLPLKILRWMRNAIWHAAWQRRQRQQFELEETKIDRN